MTDKDKKCDVCGHTEFYTGVCSSALGAMSLAWCDICLAMGAEMRPILEGIGDIRKDFSVCYYDPLKDSYIDFHTKEVVPITLKDGTELKTRTEFVKHMEKK
jgi:hypothetical protein